MEPLPLVRAYSAARVAFGAALLFKTEAMLRLMVRRDAHSGSMILFARTIGLRDVVLGLGALTSSFGDTRGLDRWLWTTLASDVADVATGATSSRLVGKGGAAAATVAPLPFVAAGAWAIWRLARGARIADDVR